MDTGLLHLHNFLRWLVLLAGVWAVVSAMGGRSGAVSFGSQHKRPALAFLILADLQLALGLILYTTRGWLDVVKGGSGFMKDAAARFYGMEHGLLMLIAIVLVHFGYTQTKRPIADKKKFNNMFIFFLIALLLMLVATPWPFREALGRPWF